MIHLLLVSAAAALVGPTFTYHFTSQAVVNETATMATSSSPYFWVASGGQFIITNVANIPNPDLLSAGIYLGATIQGPSAATVTAYQQNDFRLIERFMRTNIMQEVHFNLRHINMAETPSRDADKGIFVYARYYDVSNHYYAGITLDGRAVIRIVTNGVMKTLASTPLYMADGGYDRDTNPNVIPGKKWIGLSTHADLVGGKMHLSLDVGSIDSGRWIWGAMFTSIVDSNPPVVLRGPCYGGIRSDYFDTAWSYIYSAEE